MNRNRFLMVPGAAALALALVSVTAASVDAQDVARPKTLTGALAPRYVRPPAGMCRVWIGGVPAAKQPAPTDCVTALKDKPANGRIIFGDALPPGRFPRLKVKKSPGIQGDE